MHDLNVITRLNAEAFADSIQNYRRQGRFVLAKYEGLYLVSIETFSDQPGAQQAFDSAVDGQHGGERNVLFAPIGFEPDLRVGLEAHRISYPFDVTRAHVADVTLGDYISRKSALLDNPQE